MELTAEHDPHDKPYNKSFLRRKILQTSIPLILQLILTNSITFIDQLMIGHLGLETIAAVTACTKIFTIYQLFCYGISSSGAIFMTQYYGKKDYSGIRKILAIMLGIGLSIAVIFVAAIVLFPQVLLSPFTQDEAVMSIALDYLRWAAPIPILASIASCFGFLMRSLNRVIIVTISTIISVIVAITANYILIYGNFGCPALGVVGAAIGTVITRFFEGSVIIIFLIVSKNPVFRQFHEIFTLEKSMFINYIKKALPITCNEVLWSLGGAMFFVIYGKLGTTQQGAMSIMDTIQVLAQTIAIGFGSSAAIIIGAAIGSNNQTDVRRYCTEYLFIARIFGIFSAVTVIILIKPIQMIYHISGTEAGSIVTKCMIILAIYLIIYSRNILFMEGIFRCGGDAVYIFLMDMGSVWYIGLVFATIMYHLGMPCYVIFGAYIAIECYKFPINMHHYRSGKWMHNLISDSQQSKYPEKCATN